MKKKILIAVSAVAAIALIIVFRFSKTAKKPDEAVFPSTVALEKGVLSDTVSSTGTVGSAQVAKVYSKISYPIKTVHVEVGDKVREGDALADLDVVSLQDSLARERIAYANAYASALQSLENAKKNLADFQKSMDEEYNSNLMRLNALVTDAEIALESEKLSLQGAAESLANASRSYRDAKDGDADDNDLRVLRSNVTSADINYKRAQTGVQKAEQALKDAYLNQQALVVAIENERIACNDELSRAQRAMNFQSELLSIQRKEEDLRHAQIKAPISGIVTQVLATEGQMPGGIQFVIQNTDKLKVVSYISEYDLTEVSIGDKVNIKTDLTGDETFVGRLVKIAPTSRATAAGDIASTGAEAEFEAEISVESKNTGIIIGAGARLSFITEELSDVYYVPYEAVVEDDDGGAHVVEVIPGGDGGFTVRRIPVAIGLDTDLYTQIISDELADGMLIARDPQGAELLPATGPNPPPGGPGGHHGGEMHVGMGGGPR